MACCLTASSHYLSYVGLSCVRSSEIPMKAISQKMAQLAINKISCFLKFTSNLPGANELMLFFGNDSKCLVRFNDDPRWSSTGYLRCHWSALCLQLPTVPFWTGVHGDNETMPCEVLPRARQLAGQQDKWHYIGVLLICATIVVVADVAVPNLQ